MRTLSSLGRRALVAGAFWLAVPLWGQEKSTPGTASERVASFSKEIRPVLVAHCIKCHGAEKKKGGIDFSAMTDAATILEPRRVWKKAAAQVETLAMPPEGEKPIPDADRERLLAWMRFASRWIDPARPATPDPGPAPIRRLSRTEYDLTVRDLLGITVDVARGVGMADDAAGRVFESQADALNVSLVLTEKYFAAADLALDRLYASKDALKKVLFVTPGPDLSEDAAARTIIERFLRRAYRRPPKPQEVGRTVSVYDAARRRGTPYAESLRLMLRAVLVSPRFLFRLEESRPPEGSRVPYPVSAHELAARLSYFLWSGPPDEELSRLADQGALADRSVLEAEIRRMLRDAKAQALTQCFAAPWLRLGQFARPRPSTEFFPTFTRPLRDAMAEEPVMFLNRLREDDRSVLDLLDADYTYLNEELARHYGIDGVKGKEFRRVTLRPEDHRGGLLGMAAVLAMTSHDRRTSPTSRGKWILDVLFGTPPPPPPANAGRLKEDKAEKTPKTFREKMALHAKDPTCAGCHSRIDPLGYGLEEYDAIGGWRGSTAGAPLDTSGRLPTGEQFHGAVELKAILAARRDAFVRNLVEQMLTYALGRDLGEGDDRAVDQIQQNLEKSGYRFSALVLGIAESFPFRYRRPEVAGTDVNKSKEN